MSSATFYSIDQLCDDLVAELLDELHLPNVNVDAFEVARGMGMDVAIDAGQTGRARIKRIARRATVLLRPEERPERMHWALAHEIGESLAPRVIDRLIGETAEPADLREQWANLFASRLLLPRNGFLPLARRLQGDVPRLKEHFPHVSHEQLLWGVLRLDVSTVASVFDQGRLCRRQGNTGEVSPITPWERECCLRVHESGEPLETSRGEFRLQCWPVHDPPWKRELLRVTWEE